MSVTKLNFEYPAVDDGVIDTRRREFKGQFYDLVERISYIRDDGSFGSVLSWRGQCAECGATFTTKTPEFARKWSPSRRCPLHRQSGVRVRAVRTQGGGQ